MPNVQDDPRQVLALLNSLGFIGITAEQLKGFMKDLKMYRKIKERAHKEWKDEMKKNILKKQHDDLHNILTEIPNPQVCDDDPIVRIKFLCVSDGNNKKKECENHQTDIISSKKVRKKDENILTNQSIGRLNPNRPKSKIESSIETEKVSRKIKNQIPVTRATSAPNFSSEQITKVSRPKSSCSEPIRRQTESPRCNPSRCSSRSQSKSFIRPWKLHPDGNRVPHSLKSDPVTLYQNYQKSWKQISFPGENRHADIRWAIREKMLGTDPTPKPIIKQSCSSMSVMKRR